MGAEGFAALPDMLIQSSAFANSRSVRGRLEHVGEARGIVNVRYGSKADIPRHSHLCLLLGVKRTSKGHCRDVAPRMSALGGRADVIVQPSECPLIAISGHSDEG